jgi:DNA-binding beta-propeller fold protein YncE
VASWLLFSYAGEKMPWLTVHIALPMLLLSGWTVQQMVGRIRAGRGVLEGEEVQEVEGAEGGVIQNWVIAGGLGLLAVLFTIRFLSVLGGFDGEAGREVMIPALFNGLLSIVIVAGCLVFIKRYLTQGARAMYGLAAFAVLALLTVRTAVTVTYINYDYTKEFLFYAHGAPGPKRVLSDIKNMIERFGSARQLSIGHVQSLAWPMTWYMRDVPNSRFLGENLPDDYTSMDVILVSPNKDAKFSEWADNLAAEYDRFDQNFIWWPMEDYKGMTWDRMSYAFGNPRARAAMWEIMFNRNYEPYSQLFNKTLTAENWPLRDQITMFVRKDISAQLWDYRNGAALGSGSPVAPAVKLKQPANLAFAPDGTRWVIDHRANRLFHMDEAGGVIKTIGGTGNQPSRFNDPWGVAVDANGGVFVADTFNHRIQKFDAEGNFQFAWGNGGSTSDPGNGRDTQFFGPRDIVIDKQGRLLVTDTGNKRVQVFDGEGNFVTQFGTAGGGDGQFDEPTGVAIDGEGDIYVSDTWNKRVQVFSSDYVFLRSFPVPAWSAMDPSLFNSTEHKPFLAVHNGRVFLSSPRSGQVLVFKTSGEAQELTQLSFAPEDMPTGVEIRGDVLFVTNAKTGAVQEFNLGAGAQ